MPFECGACNYIGDDFEQISETEILRGDAAGLFETGEEVEEALSHVGEAQCPQCGSLDVGDCDAIYSDHED